MIKHSAVIFLVFCFTSCGSGKQVAMRSSETSASTTYPSVSAAADYAMNYLDVPYKYGGTDRQGMDCSGLIFTAFKQYEIRLPRTTSELSEIGFNVPLKQVDKGDLLFFKTKKGRNRITHVGLVTRSSKNQIQFIHSTTSKGVIVSKLSERYWSDAFVMARRIK